MKILRKMRQFAYLNAATAITLSRGIIGLVSARLLLAGDHGIALAGFILAAILDKADGLVARRLGIVSSTGAFLDVVCDGLVLLVYLWVLLALRAVTFLSFDLLILAGSFSVLAQLAFIIAMRRISATVSPAGRISTTLVYAACAIATINVMSPDLWRRYLPFEGNLVVSATAIFSAIFMLLFLLKVLKHALARKGDDHEMDFRVYAYEPISKWIIDQATLGPGGTLVFYWLAFTTPLLTTALATNVVFENQRFQGLRWMYSVSVGYSLILPLVFFLSVKFYLSASDVMLTLRREGVITELDYWEFVKWVKRDCGNRTCPLVIAALAVLAEIWFRLDMIHHKMWSAPHGQLNAAGWVETVIHLVTVYFVLCILVYAFITLRLLLRVLNDRVRPQYFHPDGCVGIGSVVSLITIVMDIVALLLIEFALTLLDAFHGHQPILMHLVVFVFGIFALPTLAFFVVRATHKRLLLDRNQLMKRLNDSYDSYITPRRMAADSEFAQLLRLAEADEVRRAIENIPTWPFPAYKFLVVLGKLSVTTVAFLVSLQKLVGG